MDGHDAYILELQFFSTGGGSDQGICMVARSDDSIMVLFESVH